MKKLFLVLVLASLVLGGAFGFDFMNVSPAIEDSNSSFGLDLSFIALTNGSDLSLLSTRGRSPNADGLHWTTGEKVFYGFGNWAFGIGSFMMGDIPGGLFFAGLGLLARSMFIANGSTFEPNTFGIVGLSAEILIITLSHFRVFAYDRKVSREAGTFHGSANPLNGITVRPAAMKNGDLGMGLFYSRSF
jgi:hypothetical protein